MSHSPLPFRPNVRKPSRQASIDPHNELNIKMDHYVGIDVGTGSARACIINERGDIVGLASENIGLWQPETGFYVSVAFLLCVPLLCGPCCAVPVFIELFEQLHVLIGIHFERARLTVLGTIHIKHLAVHLHVCPACHQPA